MIRLAYMRMKKWVYMLILFDEIKRICVSSVVTNRNYVVDIFPENGYNNKKEENIIQSVKRGEYIVLI